MERNKLSSVSKAATDEEMGEFWDTHDFADYDDPNVPDVAFKVTCSVPIDVDLFSALEQQAQQRGIQVETLVNLWLQQKLSEQDHVLA